ncbi:MAG: hypothetical protein ACOC9Y_04435 [Chloroflexota bacterium]
MSTKRPRKSPTNTRTPSGPTVNRRAHKATFLAVAALVLILSACSSDAELVADPTPTVTSPEIEFEPTRAPFAATQTAEAQEAPFIIERVTLATRVSRDGVPREEVSVVPADTRSMYLSVLVTDLEPPTRFRAYWFEGDEILAQSEQVVEEEMDSARWVSLGFQAQDDLDPTRPHSVELRINDQLVDTYTFRVGRGDLTDILAEETVALGTDEDGDAVGGGEVFDVLAPQIVAVIRVSNKVDPTGMIFSAFLERDGETIQQRSPDGGQPVLPDDPDEKDRQLTFTFVPEESFEIGDYTIRIMVNGIDITELPLSIVSEDDVPEPTEEPGETPTPEESPTPEEDSDLEIEAIRITEELDEDSNEPEGDGIDEWTGEPNEQRTLYLSVYVEDLQIEDVIEVDALLDGEHIERHRFPSASFDEGWLSIPVTVWAPDSGDPEKDYTYLIFLNGEREDSIRITVDNDEPSPTATEDDDD